MAPPQETAGSPNEVGGLSPPHETAGSAQEVGGLAPHPGTLQLHRAMPSSPSPLQLAQLVGDGTTRWVLQGASLFHNRRADGLGWVAVFSMARCLRPESPWRASRRTLPSCTWHRTLWARKRSVRALQYWCACRHSGCTSRGPSRFTTCPTRIMLGPICWWRAHCMPHCTASLVRVSRLRQRSQGLAGHTFDHAFT